MSDQAILLCKAVGVEKSDKFKFLYLEDAGKGVCEAPSEPPAQDLPAITVPAAPTEATPPPTYADPLVNYALARLARRACTNTQADGAALALFDGSDLVCRARNGTAPEINAALPLRSGLLNECFRTGEAVQCEDTEQDARVNRGLCPMNMRSILIVPIKARGEVVGVIEVFSAKTQAFGSTDVEILQKIAPVVISVALGPGGELEAAAPKFPDQTPQPSPLHPVVAPAVIEPASTSDDLTPAAELISILQKGNQTQPTRTLGILLAVALFLLFACIGVVWLIPQSESSAERAQNNADRAVAERTATDPATEPVWVEIPEAQATVTTNSTVDKVEGVACSERSEPVYQPAPRLPEAAQRAGVQGLVTLMGTVRGDGTMAKVRVVEGDGLLGQAAAETVRTWRYKPCYVHGRPVETSATVVVHFTIPAAGAR